MKLCFIIWGYINSGSTVSFDEYCLSLSKAGHGVEMIGRGNGERYALNENLTVTTVKDRFPRFEKLTHVTFLIDTVKILSKKNFDVINVFASPGVAILPMFSFTKNTKWILHFRTPYIAKDIVDSIKNMIMRFESYFFDGITLINRNIAKSLFFDEKMVGKIHELPLGVNPHTFKRYKDNRKRYLGLSSKNNVLIYVGNMGRQRNLHILIDAFKIVLESRNECKLILIGAGDHVDQLTKKVRELGIENSVNFLGRVGRSDVAKYIASADIGLSYLPINNTYDHQPPLKVLEYLKMGLPQVATGTQAVKNVIKHEFNGIISETDDAISFASAILLLLNDKKLYEKIKSNCNVGIEEYYWDSLTDRHLLPLFNKVLSK